MSMTKTQFHAEICANMGDFDEAEYYASQINERAINWFPESRLAHDGYAEEDSMTTQVVIYDEDIPF